MRRFFVTAIFLFLALCTVVQVSWAKEVLYSDVNVTFFHGSKYNVLPTPEKGNYAVIKGMAMASISLAPYKGWVLKRPEVKEIAQEVHSKMQVQMKLNTRLKKVDISEIKEIILGNGFGYRIETVAHGAISKLYMDFYIMMIGKRQISAILQSDSKSDFRDLKAVLESFKVK